jgi:hypothetical protein
VVEVVIIPRPRELRADYSSAGVVRIAAHSAQEAVITFEHYKVQPQKVWSFAFRIIASGLLARPPLAQKLGTPLSDASGFIDLDIADHAEPFADGTRRTEFGRGEHGSV